MLQQWLRNFPSPLGNGWLIVALIGSAAGLVLWVTGARFSRLLIGLAAVAAGGAAGMMLPRLMGWSISGAGPAVALALCLGVSALVMQRVWVGLFLATMLAGWAFFITWVSCRAPQPMHLDMTSLDAAWQSIPPSVAACLPYSCGIAAAVGMLTSLVWPRLGIAAAWSAAGVSLIAGLGSAAMQMGRPNWVAVLPEQLGPQVCGITLLVGVGVALQWRAAGRAAGGFGGGSGGRAYSGAANQSPEGDD